MEETMTRWTGVGRTIDPRLPTHQIILSLSTLAGGLGLMYAWFALRQPPLEVLRWGATAGLGVFFSWVIARELDPDHPGSALLGAVFALPSVLAVGLPHVVLALWVVLLLRIVNRSTGLAARPLDTLGLLGLTIWVAVDLHLSLLLITALAFILDGTLRPGHPFHSLLGGGIAVAAVVALLTVAPPITALESLPIVLILALTTLLYLLTALSQPPQAAGDYTGETLSEARVRAAQSLAPALGWMLLVVQSLGGVQASLPLWSAMLSVGGFGLARRRRPAGAGVPDGRRRPRVGDAGGKSGGVEAEGDDNADCG